MEGILAALQTKVDKSDLDLMFSHMSGKADKVDLQDTQEKIQLLKKEIDR